MSTVTLRKPLALWALVAATSACWVTTSEHDRVKTDLDRRLGALENNDRQRREQLQQAVDQATAQVRTLNAQLEQARAQTRNLADLAARYAWTSVKLGAMIFGAIGAFMFAFPRGVLGVFSHEPAVIEAGAVPMRIMATMGPVVAVAMILTQALFGAGETRYVMIVEVSLHFLCLVPLAWLFGMVLGLGLPGVWTAVAVYAVALAGLMALKFLRGGWKKLTV